ARTYHLISHQVGATAVVGHGACFSCLPAISLSSSISDFYWEVWEMNRKGFTLIELLIVVVIIGILAAIAIPKFANTKEKAYIASMKSDLRNLVTAEEAYFADSVKYTAATACTATAGSATYCETNGNTLSGLVTSSEGWKSNITNANTTKTCAIFIGSTSNTPATKEGEPKCQ